MTKKFFVIITALLLVGITFADETGISQKELKALTGSVKLEGKNRMLFNAVTNNSIRDLAVDREVMNHYNTLVNYKLEVDGITDQKSTGRCWLFAALNIMRPGVKEKFNLKSFEFSQNYLFFYDKLEKANMFLDAMIELRNEDLQDRNVQELIGDPIPDGGWWNYAVALIEKYGAVPKSIMPETNNSEASRQMNSLIGKMLKHDAMELRNMAAEGASVKQLQAKKETMMKHIYRILVLTLGKPVDEFDWRYEDKDGKILTKQFTPKTFYKEAVDLDLSDYVTVLEHPVYDFNDHYTIEYCRNMSNMSDMNFVNIPAKDFKAWTKKAMVDGLPIWFAATAGQGMNRTNGIMDPDLYDYETLFDIDITFTKHESIRYGWGIPNHAMVLVGMDTTDTGETQKWLVENSWGTDSGDKGYYTMSDDWFDRYVFNVILPKKYLPKDIQKLLDKKPQQIPSWDPMREAFLK
ncbi:MAG: C1 family peptidase [Fidelibacterota bacterium]